MTLRCRPRRGYSLIELMIAMVLMLAVFGMVVTFLRTQTRQIASSAGALDALQNARFSGSAIDRELRVAGAGIVAQQPMMVLAAPMAVAFNVDLTTIDSTDPSGVYYDPNADTSTTSSMTVAHQVTLPTTAYVYPGMNYQSTPGVASAAQTIMYWLAADPTAPLPNTYTLFRRVNAADSTVVSTGIRVAPGTAFFRYFVRDSVTGNLDSIPTARLPLFHSVPQHGGAADTGSAARIDSVRSVRITVTGAFKNPSGPAVYRTTATTTKLLNAGLVNAATCGQPPLSVNPVPLATPFLHGGVAPTDSIVVTWNASVDQDGGQQTVARYLVYKKLTTTATWGQPVTTFAAGAPTYRWNDPAYAGMHGSWQYAVVAQDCTPANSTMAVSSAVTLP
jgi:prepilin-type N-terminal cleavage/methylation domain-containing protein